MLSLLAFERIARQAGVKRVSKKALEELREIIDEEASELAAKAVQISKHAQRNTVMDRDVKLAAGIRE